MIDFWNGIHTPDGAVWFNRFTNEYEFEKRPDGFDWKESLQYDVQI